MISSQCGGWRQPQQPRNRLQDKLRFLIIRRSSLRRTTTQQRLDQVPVPNQTNKTQEATVSPVTLLKIQRQAAYRCQAANKPIHTGQRKPGFQENPEPTSKQWSPALICCQTAPAGKQGARISFHTSGQTEQTRAVASFGFGFYRTCTDPRVRACVPQV